MRRQLTIFAAAMYSLALISCILFDETRVLSVTALIILPIVVTVAELFKGNKAPGYDADLKERVQKLEQQAEQVQKVISQVNIAAAFARK